MDPEQAYVVHGADPGEDEKSIKEKYRQLMRKHHPESAGDPSEQNVCSWEDYGTLFVRILRKGNIRDL